MEAKLLRRSSSRIIRAAIVMAVMAAALLPGFPGKAQTGELLGVFTADENGEMSGTVEIPEDTAPGTYDLVARGTAGPNAGGSDSGYGGEQLLVDDTTVTPGQDVEVHSGGWQPGTTVTITLEAANQASALGELFGGVAFAQVNRELSATIRVVADSRSGGGTTTGGTTTGGTIAGGTTTGGTTTGGGNTNVAPGGSLARTGLSVLPWAVAGSAALGIGALFLLAARRRKGSDSGSQSLPQV